ncbi:MAG: hypothetical protein OEV06_04515, partial [Anaerolineae bacterium]|nr:hypothetical protein [Anaerolineae bacterium]
MTNNSSHSGSVRLKPRDSVQTEFPETQKILDFGRDQGWQVQPLGRAPLPDQPVHLGRWLIIPAEQDTTPVPARSMERIQALFAAGVRPKGFVVVHEAPPLLPEKVGESQEEIHISTWSPATRQLTRRLTASLGIG